MEKFIQLGVNITEEQCTGCAACRNVCPNQAISMAENAEGFIFPKVDEGACSGCGLCVKICPALGHDSGNMPDPPCYAFRADDAMRRHSASGGAFAVLAKAILALGGAVAGAVFDENQRLKHIVSDKLQDMDLMRGSKYVQSDINFAYREVKELLSAGRLVLFSGTPCQVAGLKAFLQQKHENLFTVDLLCHGVPSQKIFQKHLAELAGDKAIKQIFFREKGDSLNASNFKIMFKNGKTYSIRQGDNLYFKGFLENLFLRKSCASCRFSALPRQGDMSIGDFWGYSSVRGGDYDGRGTSLVLINSKNGYSLLAILEREGRVLHKTNIDIKKWNNIGVVVERQIHNARSRFFQLSQTRTFSAAANECLDNYFDIGLVGPYNNHNFGGFLTYYALYQILEDLGYSVCLISSPACAPCHAELPPIKETIEKCPYPNWALAEVKQTRAEMAFLNQHCGQFVTGSDQIFNPPMHEWLDKVCQLDWVNDDKKKIAYAASFGIDEYQPADVVRDELSRCLKRFDAISTREKSGINICREKLGVEAVSVMDPVFLCAERHWQKLASDAPCQNPPDTRFLCAFLVETLEMNLKLIEEICQEKNIDSRIYTQLDNEQWKEINLYTGTINAILRDLMECKFIVTDSFHGTCFAILFRKDFIVCGYGSIHEARMTSLLSDAGLMARIIHSLEEFHSRKASLLEPIDYYAVYDKLQPKIDMSLRWLKNNLQEPKKKSIDAYEMFSEKLDIQNADIIERLSDLKTAISSLDEGQKYLAGLFETHGRTLANECPPRLLREVTDFQQYVEALKGGEYLILIAANSGDESVDAALATLGLNARLRDNCRQAYLAALHKGKVILDRAGKTGESLTAKLESADLAISLRSSSFESGQNTQIIINGKDWAINRRGLNFVVIDCANMGIIDAACYDASDAAKPEIRRK